VHEPRLRQVSYSARSAGCAIAFVSGMISAGNTAAADPGFVLAMLASPAEVILLAVFSGAMSFALMSAFWLVRERARIVGFNNSLTSSVSELRAANERLEALVDVSDQRIVIWAGADERPVMLGHLSAGSGAPKDRSEFLAFGRWLAPDAAIGFEAALRRLRSRAEAFDLPLIARNGGVMEAQGRTSGGLAFVRFIELSGERSTLLQLEAEHSRLSATFDCIQSLFETLPGPVWLRDATGRLFWVNNAYAKAVDCADGVSAVTRGAELLDSLQRRELGRAVREQRPYVARLPVIVSGDRRVMEVSEIATEAGGAGLAVDRDEVEKIRALLDQTVATHAQTLDYLAAAVAMFDFRQQLQFHNSSFQKLWNLDEGFLAGRPTNAQLLDAMRAANRLPEFPDWRKWRESQLEIYRALEPREEWWHLPGGETIRVVVNPHKRGGATWIFENVTEKLELQSSYNALIRIQGETLDNLNEAVAVFGADGRLRLCNPVFANVWRLGEAESKSGLHISALSARCQEILKSPGDWDAIAEAITGLDDQRGDLDGRFETADGVALDFSLVRLPEGQTMLALIDMTDSVGVERALKERNEALEQSDRLKNRFIQHVSYELRAPLTSIGGFAEMLTMPQIGRLNHKQAEYVGHITQSASILKAIIDDILDLATIDAGAMRLECEEVRLAEVVADCASELGEQMDMHSIRFEAAIDPAANRLEGDPRRLRQIVGNLISNAIRFSPDGGMVSVASALAESAIELHVTDEGPGIEDEEKAAVFRRFESRSDAKGRRGAGLGLSIVKSFVELHGGNVRVEAAEGGGARFICTFPLGPVADRRAA
jgi:signal transduction histidine kinase